MPKNSPWNVCKNSTSGDKRYRHDGKLDEDTADEYYSLRAEIKARLRSHGGVTACIKMTAAHPQISCLARDFDAQPYLLNVPHNTLHLRHKLERAHYPQREDLLTYQAPVKYDPKQPCPTWEKFIRDLLLDDEEMIRYLQR